MLSHSSQLDSLSGVFFFKFSVIYKLTKVIPKSGVCITVDMVAY